MKTPYQKRHLSNASDRFFKRMWLPQLISSHIQICFEKKPFSRFVVSLERLGERPWVTERPWKTLLALKDFESQKVFFIFMWLLLYFLTICTTVFMPKLKKLIISRGLYQKLSGSAGIYFQEQKENSRSSAKSLNPWLRVFDMRPDV